MSSDLTPAIGQLASTHLLLLLAASEDAYCVLDLELVFDARSQRLVCLNLSRQLAYSITKLGVTLQEWRTISTASTNRVRTHKQQTLSHAR